MARVFLGLGSNEGDRLAQISRAAQRLGTVPQIRLVQMAPIIETEPLGGPPQDRFLNTVLELETALGPRELLKIVKHLETELGRNPQAPRWGPRSIDLDILLYNAQWIEEPDLTIPHKEMHKRRFVLEPLAHLAPDLIHPVLRQSIATLRDALVDQPPGGC